MKKSVMALLLFLVMFTSDAMALDWGAGGGGRDPKAVRILAQSAVPVVLTGTAAETTLASYTLKGGTMGNNGAIRVSTAASITNSSNTKTLKVKLSTLASGVSYTTSVAGYEQRYFRNRGAQNSQLTQSSTSMGATGAAVLTGAIDTSTDQLITITGQLANTGETITLEGYTIELLPGIN